MNKAKTRLSIIFTLSVMAILISVFVLANPTNPTLATNDISGVTVIIPQHAVKVADNVFSLGTAQDVDGRTVEGFLFIDYKKGYHHRPGHSGGPGGNGGGSKCFAFLAKGAKWKTTEQYITGTGVDATLTETSLNAWDTEVSFEIFGTRDTAGTTDGADTESPDGKNEVEFVNLGASNTIAFAIVWGFFIGPPSQRELVEWDVVFNTAYAFGDADDDSSVMDYQNIATHEFGHAVGLGHPADECTEETMYAFADFGETKKRTLESGDIAGVNDLYS